MSLKRTGQSGFSLIELLVVIALIAILLALSTRGFNYGTKASSLTTTAQQAGDLIVLARQTAVARNLPVEVRFYKLPDYDAGLTANATLWRAMQIVIRDGEREVPVASDLYFQRHVIIPEAVSISPLLAHLGEEQTPLEAFGEYPASTIRYKSFMIRPDSTLSTPLELASDLWFFTLHHEDAPTLEENLPHNFATLQVNPVTARVTILRP